VDVLAEKAGKLQPIEIKSGAVIAQDWFKGLANWSALAGEEAVDATLVYGGETRRQEDDVSILPWKQISSLANRI